VSLASNPIAPPPTRAPPKSDIVSGASFSLAFGPESVVDEESESPPTLEPRREYGFDPEPVVDKRGRPLVFTKGMKVEAVDRSFKDIITVATIKDIDGDRVGIFPWHSLMPAFCGLDGSSQKKTLSTRHGTKNKTKNCHRVAQHLSFRNSWHSQD
jgi:hypothetical protein